MTRLFWAFSERLIQRGSSALMTLAVALVVGPADYGSYAVMALTFSVYQALIETTSRQIGPTWLLTGKGISLRNFALLGGLAGSMCMAVVLAFLTATESVTVSAFLYLPILIAPIVGSVGLAAVAKLELADDWRFLSKVRTAVSLLSLLSAGLVLAIWQSILAATLQTFIVEAAFSIIVQVRAKNKMDQALLAREDMTPVTLAHPLVLNGLGWGQGQSDRVALAFFSSVSRLGEYTFAVSLGRAVTDAISSGIVAIIRRDLAHSTGAVADVVGATIRRAAVLVAVAQLAVLGVAMVLGQFVPAQWSEATRVVPIVSCLALPSLWSWAVAAYRVHQGEARQLYPTQLISMMLGVVVAVGVANSLLIGCALLLGRELFQATVRVWQARKMLPARVMCESLGLFGATGLLSVMTTLFWL